MAQKTAQWIPIEQRTKRCEAEIISKYRTDEDGSQPQCKLRGVVNFGGAILCKRHAMQAALKAALNGADEPSHLPPMEERAP